MSLSEIAGTPRAALYAVNVPAPAYVEAVQQVRTAKKGTLISRAPKTVSSLAVPEIVPNAINNPLGTIWDSVGSLWLGSPADKLKTMGQFIPAEQTTTSYDIATGEIKNTEKMSDIVNTIIDTGSKTPEGDKFWNTHTLLTTDIEVPEIHFPEIPDLFGWVGDLPKYALLAGAALIAVLILTRK